MKYFVLAVFVVFTTFSAQASASDVFEIDYNQVSQQLEDLAQVEEFVLQNPGITHGELAQLEPELAERVGNHARLGYTSATMQGPLGIPSFLWGCVLGVIGILIVYLVAKDRAETTSALWGCLVGLVFWTIMEVSFNVFSGLF